VDKSTGDLVRAGFDRACDQFGEYLESLGFHRARKRFWTREHGGRLAVVHLFRGGSSYGSPASASVQIRVHFSLVDAPLRDPVPLNGPSSDQLRDPDGKAYHLRFNAASGSTYDLCVEHLRRVVAERGLPWFSAAAS
jgi:hypothetical protein